MGDKSGVRLGSGSSIVIEFSYHGRRCRERLKLKPTPQNLNYAAKLKASIEIEIGKGIFDYRKHFPDSPRAAWFSTVPGDHLRIGDYVDSWLDVEKDNIKPSTLYGYKKIIRHTLRPAFGRLALSELKRKHVWEWAAAHPKLSAKRMRNILSVLRIALNAAVEQEFIEVNPLVGFKSRKRSTVVTKHAVDPFSSEERAVILQTLEGQNRNLVQFAFWTGLRTSEYIALDWTDIDERRGVVMVTKALTIGMETPEEGTKTEAGWREVKLLAPAWEALQAQKAYTYLKGVEIFQNPRTGERWAGDRPIREGMWTSGLKRAKVRYRKPYQCRHTYASMMLTAGEHVMWVASQMGHRDWSLTAKRYARWIPSDMPDAGGRAEKLFGSASSTLGPHGAVKY